MTRDELRDLVVGAIGERDFMATDDELTDAVLAKVWPEIERLANERDHAAEAAKGSHEGIRLWMLDCSVLVQKHRDRADWAEAKVREYEAALGRLADKIDQPPVEEAKGE